VDLKTLQRFAGKCISLVLAVPAARLYSREVNRAISLASKNSKPMKIYEELRQEIEYWKFLDEWTGVVSWRKEKHFQIVLATDSSNFKWEAFMVNQGRIEEFGDFWDNNDTRPIHVKEACHRGFNCLVYKQLSANFMVFTTILFAHTSFLWATCCLICFIPIVKPFLTH
jgi:hypothetical protein